MQTFITTCKTLGLDQVSSRGQKLAASIPALQSENCLFFICGYDFITNPNDLKFTGLQQLFVRRNSPFELNLYGNCIDAFNRALNPAVSANIEGTGWMGKGGQKVSFSPGLMAQQAGVRVGGAGNYNMQTKALEIIVTHAEGLDKDGALALEIVTKLQFAFGKPPAAPSAITRDTLNEMRNRLTPYWGAATSALGL